MGQLAVWKPAFKRHRARCVYCDAPIDFSASIDAYLASTVDHLIPDSRGGANVPENIVPSCAIHNYYKRDEILDPHIMAGFPPRFVGGKVFIAVHQQAEYIRLIKEKIRRNIAAKRKEYEAFKAFFDAP